MMAETVVGAEPANNTQTDDPQSFVVVEQNIDDFKSWKSEDHFKNIVPNVCVSYNKKVNVDMVSDAVAWNITNLRQPLDWPLPTETVAPGAKVKSVIWIQLFKSYVMKYMKDKVKSNYLILFNSEKYRCLRSNHSILMNYKEMCRILSPVTSESVRIVALFCFVLNKQFLNLNSHVCCF